MAAGPISATALDSNLYCTIFGNDEMRAIIGDVAYEARMVEVEVALAQVQADLGMIPIDAAEDIRTKCKADKLDRSRLRGETELVGLPVWGLTRQLSEMAGGASGRYIHWGLNTHDVMDLARALQMKDGLRLISEQLNGVRDTLVRLTHEYRNTPMIARTHLQHALPSSFGYRVAIWLSAMDRHAERLPQILPRVLLAQVGGASGSLASFGGVIDDDELEPDGLRVVSALSSKLGLVEPCVPWHATRDGLAEAVLFLALVGGSLAKIALDVSPGLPVNRDLYELMSKYVPGYPHADTRGR